MKDLSASKLKFLEYQNFLPGEGEIKLEDSFLMLIKYLNLNTKN